MFVLYIRNNYNYLFLHRIFSFKRKIEIIIFLLIKKIVSILKIFFYKFYKIKLIYIIKLIYGLTFRPLLKINILLFI